MEPHGVNVYVVDDDEHVRDLLRELFASVSLPVQTFSSGQEFLHAYIPGSPGCLVIDMRMPGMSSFDVQAELAARGIHLPVIVVTGYGDVEESVRAMKAGAVDFIQKPFNNQALLEMVQRALSSSAEYHRSERERQQLRGAFDRLTPRERDVLERIVGGEPNKRIAHDLGLSAKTVEFHRANLMKKLHVRSVAELVRKALVMLSSVALVVLGS